MSSRHRLRLNRAKGTTGLLLAFVPYCDHKRGHSVYTPKELCQIAKSWSWSGLPWIRSPTYTQVYPKRVTSIERATVHTQKKRDRHIFLGQARTRSIHFFESVTFSRGKNEPVPGRERVTSIEHITPQTHSNANINRRI